MANRKLFSPVYPLLTPDDDTRINPHVSARDCSTIVSVTGNSQILSHICQLAIKHAADYIRVNNLDFTTSSRFVDYLRERSVTSPNAAEAVARDVRGRVAGGGEHVTDAASGESESRKSVTAGSRGQESKGRKVVGKSKK